ncbi:MAG: hypothetical protein IJQ12_10605 [Lachnospiraceae bacterium]|nr:hypothetical protein [Lachnospiraceae bacterium]
MGTVIEKLQDMRHLEWSKTRHSSGSAGSFLKAYEDTDGKRIYYKLSEFDSVRGITGHECANEIIADRLLDLLQIDHVEYTLIHALVRIGEKEYETWMCASDSFRDVNERKISLEDYYQAERNQGESPMEFCARMGWERYICEMLVVDYLILNRDRHGANMEILIDRRKKTVRPAPLFDHGLSFVCRCQTEEMLKGVDVMQDKKVQSFVGTSSARDNLQMVPLHILKKLPSVQKEDRKRLFDGLEGVLSKKYRDTIWKMIEKRWNVIETIRRS